MKMTSVEIAHENFMYRLKGALNDVGSADPRDDDFYEVALNYRYLAQLKLLMEADQQSYVNYMCNSANSRLYFLRDFAPMNYVKPEFLCVSKDIAVNAALAVGHFDLVREISRYSAETHNPLIEYEDDYLFYRFMQKMVDYPFSKEELHKMLSRWEEVLAGQNSIEYLICSILLNKSVDEFEDTFQQLLAQRSEQLDAWSESPAFNKEWYLLESNIYIEGICILRLAMMQGIPIKHEYPLVPNITFGLDNVVFPSSDGWRTP
jgi:hypothetical protein